MNRTGVLGCVGLLAAVMVGCAAEATDTAASESEVIASTSAFTPLEEPNGCSDWESISEDGSEKLCPGMQGYSLAMQSHLDFFHARVDAPGADHLFLDTSKLPSFFNGFTHLGPKAEWRGRGIAIGQVDPYALIFRYFATDETGVEKNWLVVTRVEKDNACVLDTVSGAIPNHNVKAQQIADANHAFICPLRGDCDTLRANGQIAAGKTLPSCERNEHPRDLAMQADGNFVLYDKGVPTWHTHTNGSDAVTAIMQGDGNLVLYSAAGVARWSSGTQGNPGAFLTIQQDGKLVIEKPAPGGPVVIWTANP